VIVAAPLLEVQDLSFSYGATQILFEISLAVEPGEALALLGTNGAGKSTLLRVVCGLEAPSAGSIRLENQDIAGVPAERLVDHGLLLVPGGRAVFTDMTVADNLHVQSLPARRNKAALAERRERVLETFPALAGRLGTPAGLLSGGEQQQLALAKALLLQPRLLCIDELSLGLAPVVVGELIAIVREINASGVAVVVVEQSLNIAAQLCPRAVFLEKGRVRFEGRTADLLEDDQIARAVFFGAS
jgi:ABC-type branched-subunit amino acid transport system ATPase component